ASRAHLAWLDLLGRERDNVRAAMRWAEERRDAEMLLRLAGHLWEYWGLSGLLSEGQRWLAVGLAQGGTVPPAVRARALGGLGAMAYFQGDYRAGVPALQESLVLCRALGDSWNTAWLLHILGLLVGFAGEPAAARRHFAEAVALLRELGDDAAAGQSLF